MKSQTDLIGPHPQAPNKFGEWLSVEDVAVTKTKRHRALEGKIATDDAKLIAWLSQKIIEHHYDDYSMNRLKEKFGKIGYKKYAETHRKLPRADRVKKGNATEIILTEYIESTVGKKLVKIFKLKYNPNVDQAIKGDDTLLIDVTDGLPPRVFLGEAKFRTTPGKSVVDDILKSLGKGKKPLSLSYVASMIAKDDKTLADKIDDLIIDDIKGKGGLIYTGMLLSNQKTKNVVETHLNSNNPTFIMISVAIENPGELINAAFAQAEIDLVDNLKKP